MSIAARAVNGTHHVSSASENIPTRNNYVTEHARVEEPVFSQKSRWGSYRRRSKGGGARDDAVRFATHFSRQYLLWVLYAYKAR